MKAAAESFRENPAFDTKEAITELGTGEALISFLDEDGKPQIVQRAMVIAPACSMDAAPDSDKRYCIDNSPLNAKYKNAIDRESAYELLDAKAIAAAEAAKLEAEMAELAKQQAEAEKIAEKERIAAEKELEQQRAAAQKELERQLAAEEKERLRKQRELEKEAERAYREQQKEEARRKREFERAASSVLTSTTRTVANGLARGILGALTGKR